MKAQSGLRMMHGCISAIFTSVFPSPSSATLTSYSVRGRGSIVPVLPGVMRRLSLPRRESCWVVVAVVGVLMDGSKGNRRGRNTEAPEGHREHREGAPGFIQRPSSVPSAPFPCPLCSSACLYAAIRIETGEDHGPTSPLALVQR